MNERWAALTIENSANYLERFSGLDMAYYRQHLPPDQFNLLMKMVGVEPAPDSFDPTETYYPEECDFQSRRKP